MDKGAWRANYRTWDRKESDRTEYFLKDDAVKVLHSICQQIHLVPSSYRVLPGSIYSFLLVRYSCLLSADVLHALLCLKAYS